MYWLLLLFLAMVQSAGVILGTDVYQRRPHRGLRLVNDLLSRFQLGYAFFLSAILINFSFPDEFKILKAIIFILLFLALIFGLWGLRLASSSRLQRILADKTHRCTGEEKCTIKLDFRTAARIVSGSLISFSILTVFVALVVFSLKPASNFGGEVMQKPQNDAILKTVPYEGEPEWQADHFYRLQQEGERLKPAELIKKYALGAFEWTASTQTYPFTMVLHVPQGYTLAVRAAFIEGNENGRSLLEPLNKISSDNEFEHFTIEVPECGKQDKVFVLFRLDSKNANDSTDVGDVVQASIQ